MIPEENNLGPGQPIEKSTGELMMKLYQARIKAVSAECPDLGVVSANEPQQLFFKLSNLNDLLDTLNSGSGSGYVACCLGLTVLDAEGYPTDPTPAQLTIMQDLVTYQEEGNYEDYKALVQTISLGQTVLIAGCNDQGVLNVQTSGVYSFYDRGQICCK